MYEEASLSGLASSLFWNVARYQVLDYLEAREARSFDRTYTFGRVVVSLLASPSPSRNALPEWVGYWSFPVQDPMGNTVEISTPDRAAWT